MVLAIVVPIAYAHKSRVDLTYSVGIRIPEYIGVCLSTSLATNMFSLDVRSSYRFQSVLQLGRCGFLAALHFVGSWERISFPSRESSRLFPRCRRSPVAVLLHYLVAFSVFSRSKDSQL